MDVLGIFVESDHSLDPVDIGLHCNGSLVPGSSQGFKVPIMFLSSRGQAMDIVMAINMVETTLS